MIEYLFMNCASFRYALSKSPVCLAQKNSSTIHSSYRTHPGQGH
jgi:hypothetical protein